MRTYTHPVLSALRYLQDVATSEASGGLKAAPFHSADEAVALLRRHSGKNFGADPARWRDWFRHNRWALEPIDLVESGEVPLPHFRFEPEAPGRPVDQSITDTWLESDRPA